MCLATKMSASKCIHYFSDHPAAFGFQSSTLPDNITLTPVNRMADQSLIRISDWHWCCLLMPLSTWSSSFLISRVALVDTVSSLPNSEGRVILVLEVCEFLLKVRDILDNVVSKQVGNLNLCFNACV